MLEPFEGVKLIDYYEELGQTGREVRIIAYIIKYLIDIFLICKYKTTIIENKGFKIYSYLYSYKLNNAIYRSGRNSS